MSKNRFSTFEGVFTPCLLSLLGVIMYLRLGWVVGHAGLAGALLIITFSNLITLATGLSMSSIVTNIRIGAGGAYSIITKSLGLEAGGAIGLPLYISQAISVAFYITGFSECWLFVFPSHNIMVVSLFAWFIILVISYLSAKLAFRIQYGIMALIAISFFSILFGQGKSPDTFSLLRGFPKENFWGVFSVFFPAVTGILAGASMSGELKDPRRSIPVGTLAAIGVSFVLYVILAIWFAKQSSLAELKVNNSIALDIGRWRWAVIAGIMGATLSSAMAMFVGAPRILMALGKHDIVPFSKSVSQINKRGEPAAAILFTSLIVLITLLVGSLNQIASLLTMFFLITYGMINLTVFIESTIGIASFRPTFKVPGFISFLGALGCLIVMFLINIKFSLIAICVIIATYWILLKKEAKVYSPDIRSGMLSFLAEEFAKVSSRLPYYPKIWKPNLLVPVSGIDEASRILPLVKAIISPAGRVTFLKIYNPQQDVALSAFQSPDTQDKISRPDVILRTKLAEIAAPLKEEGFFVETTVAESTDFVSGCTTVIQALKGMLFPPNTMFYLLDEKNERDYLAEAVIKKSSQEDLGIIVLNYHDSLGFCQEELINLWIRRKSPNIDLAILIALQIKMNWEGRLRLIQAVEYEYQKQEALEYLIKIKDIMRIPLDVEIEILVGDFSEVLKNAPPADINIFGMQEIPDVKMIRSVAQKIQTSVLFLRDSKHESALA